MPTSRSASFLTFSAHRSVEAPFDAENKSGIVGSSTTIKRLRQQVRRIGPHFRTVLASGEAGSGDHRVDGRGSENMGVHRMLQPGAVPAACHGGYCPTAAA